MWGRDDLKIEYTILSGTLKQKPLKAWIDFFLLSAILLLSMLIPPSYEGSLEICLFKNTFGIPCAGCGMTRAFLFLGHGNIYEAIKLNPNSLLSFSIIILLWFNKAVQILKKKEAKIYLTHKEKILLYFLAGLTIVTVWVYNLRFNPLI